MAENTLQHTPYGDFQFAVKAGLAWGETHWGVVSSADRGRATYYFEGEAIDSCSAAEKLAQPGQILLSSAFQALIQARVESVPVDIHHLLTGIEPLPGAGRSKCRISTWTRWRFFPRSLLIQD
jgi:class 3 adenylate cyclase